MCGRSCGRGAVEVATSHHGRCSRSAAGAASWRLFGCITVPLPRSVGRVRSAQGVAQSHLGTASLWTDVVKCLEGDSGHVQERPGGWMGSGALMNRRLPCPYCCGGRLWTVTHGFFGCGITVDLVRRP